VNVWIIVIDFPNVQDRMEIFNFHLNEQLKNGMVVADVSKINWQQLVNVTENYTGADLSQIVQMANAEAIRQIFTVSDFR
jgi:SpoVK/Ycf46/Vps4 family AAA+-type ATPase